MFRILLALAIVLPCPCGWAKLRESNAPAVARRCSCHSYDCAPQGQRNSKSPPTSNQCHCTSLKVACLSPKSPDPRNNLCGYVQYDEFREAELPLSESTILPAHPPGGAIPSRLAPLRL